MSWCAPFWLILCGPTLCAPLDLMSVSFPRLGKFSVIISSDMFSAPFSVSSHCGFPVMLVRLILSQGSLRLSSVLFILFTLFCSSAVISTILSSSSLIHSSASDILLLIPSKVFLISVIMLFSVCLFFNSSRFLLILAFSPSCFQGFFFFYHFYYHYSEFFFG